jgi:hypothetical protein
MNVWHRELQSLNANYKVISGLNEQRYDNAVNAIDGFLDTISE